MHRWRGVARLFLVGCLIASPALAADVRRGETVTATVPVGEKVNINTAGVKELMTLAGVGRRVAEKIVEYRKANGLFQKPEEVRRVQGIGAGFIPANLDVGLVDQVIAVDDDDAKALTRRLLLALDVQALPLFALVASALPRGPGWRVGPGCTHLANLLPAPPSRSPRRGAGGGGGRSSAGVTHRPGYEYCTGSTSLTLRGSTGPDLLDRRIDIPFYQHPDVLANIHRLIIKHPEPEPGHLLNEGSILAPQQDREHQLWLGHSAASCTSSLGNILY